VILEQAVVVKLEVLSLNLSRGTEEKTSWRYAASLGENSSWAS